MFMKERNKRVLSTIIIVILLPYILTVFIKGEGVFVVQTSLTNRQVEVEVNGVIMNVTWEEYLIGLLAKEIPEVYSLEAMKAQAIIIRTRLAVESGGNEDYIYHDDFYSTEEIQLKWGNDSVTIYNQLIEAVEETNDMVLKYEGELASTPYHILNTGTTRNGNEVLASDEYPYLVSVSCPLDITAEEEITMTTIAYGELTQILEEEMEIILEEELVFDDIQVNNRDEAGYVLNVEIQENVISGELFRTTLGLKSSAFSLQEVEGELKITTEGVGHGLGLSQNTAHYMGLEGKTYQEILVYFYSGTELTTQ